MVAWAGRSRNGGPPDGRSASMDSPDDEFRDYYEGADDAEDHDGADDDDDSELHLELTLEDAEPRCPGCDAHVERFSNYRYRCLGSARHELVVDGGELVLKRDIMLERDDRTGGLSL